MTRLASLSHGMIIVWLANDVLLWAVLGMLWQCLVPYECVTVYNTDT